MPGFRLAQRVIAPECPQCLRLVFLTFGTAVGCTEDGTVIYDGDLAKAGLLLHMTHGCEARSE